MGKWIKRDNLQINLINTWTKEISIKLKQFVIKILFKHVLVPKIMSVNTLMIPTVGTGEHRPDSWSSLELWRLWSQWVISISPLTHSPWPQDPCPGTQTAGPWFWFHDSFGHYHYKQQIVVTYIGLVCCPHTITCLCQMLLHRRCSMFYTRQYAWCLKADIHTIWVPREIHSPSVFYE